MKTIVYVLLAVALVSGCLQGASTDQISSSICTIEDEEAGTCPPGSLTVAQFTQQRQVQYAQSQLPGQTPTALGSSCSSDGRVCTAEWTFNAGSWGQVRVITSCNSCQCNSDLCWADEPCMHVAPGPNCMR